MISSFIQSGVVITRSNIAWELQRLQQNRHFKLNIDTHSSPSPANHGCLLRCFCRKLTSLYSCTALYSDDTEQLTYKPINFDRKVPVTLLIGLALLWQRPVLLTIFIAIKTKWKLNCYCIEILLPDPCENLPLTGQLYSHFVCLKT